ncbi:hypothetical protein [Chryseolinea sp. H1M3-3]|uniref:hypothetical protein n=1 Tax=Chryseolinea sp. H1M3-3 TaxID=3034144 RepID=UPI0023EDC1FD|nr:hypothetical protein [Chryseolinea sp. H1M3-3]
MKGNLYRVRIASVALVVSLYSLYGYSQTPMVAMPSPNAASLGTFGEIPVSGFTGVPNINIPVYTAKSGDLSIPISLAYHTSLVKPDHPPGWIGFGWDLATGGSITRISRGNNLYDENLNNGPNPSFLTWRPVFAQSDWTSASKIDMLTDLFHLNNDYEADQFSFNFGGYSGTFYLNHNGVWVVQSQSPMKLKIAQTSAQSQPGFFGNAYIIARYYETFSITTEDGVEYIFGNTPINSDPTAIEFSVNATKSQSGNHQMNLIPTTWNLTKVISPSGWEIVLTYVRGTGIYQMTKFMTKTSSRYDYNYAPCSSLFPFGPPCYQVIQSSTSLLNGYNVNLIYPSYLDQITMRHATMAPTADNGRIKFNRSVSTQLYYDAIELDLYTTPGMGPGFSGSIRQKLDNITVYNLKNEIKNRFNFIYAGSPTTRLRLDKLEEIDGSGGVKRYEFYYDTQPLPTYNSGMIDHWGYYIGGTSYYNAAADIITTRNVTPANAPKMQAGILKKITYPTGGSTEFDYEPHSYSSVVTKSPFAIDNKGQNLLTGGVRISSTRNRDSDGRIVAEKIYKYITNYIGGGTLSSGILAGEPRYTELWDFGNEQYGSFYDHIVQPMSYTNGSHITYSEVTEIEVGNGYKVSKFTNSNDPNYRDKDAYYTPLLTNNSKSFLPFNSLAYTRGNLLSETTYNEAKAILSDISYQYNYQPPNQYDANNTRALFYRWFDLYRVQAAYSDFTFCPYVIKKTVKEYNQSGANPVTSVIDYTYTINNQLKEEKATGSDGIKLVNRYKYPLDFTAAESPSEISRLKELNIIAPMIEKITYQDLGATKRIVGGEYYEFKEFYTKIAKPWKIYQLNSTSLPDLSTFYFKRRNVVSTQTQHLVVDECCQLLATTPFTIPNLGTIEASLTMHLENASPYHGNFRITINGPSSEFFESFTVVGSTINDVYSIDFSKPLNLLPGSYTITLEYRPSGGYENTYYYGWCDLNVDVINGYQYNTEIEPRIILNYNSVGNTIENEKVNDYVTSYKWGYSSTEPIAQITNARDNEAAVFDFESETGTITGLPHSGVRHRDGDFAAPFTPPNSKPYKVSFWYRIGTVWYFSGLRDYTQPTTLTDGEAIDDVRIHPADAQVNTYTYDPLVGAKSKSDFNSMPTYYEYDSFNRLKLIRDQNNDVLTLYKYNYKKQ